MKPFLLALLLTMAAAPAPQPPFLAVFKRGGKTLVYVASKHATGSENPTVKTVYRAVDGYSPQLVLLEGMFFEDEKMRRAYLGDVTHCEMNYFRGCDETLYAAKLAHDRKIAFDGADPTGAEVMTALAPDGYAPRDIVGAALTRELPAWKVETSSASALAAREDAFLTQRFAQARVPQKWDHADFAAWSAGKDAAYLEKLDARLNAVRERRLLQRIDAAFRRYDRVLVLRDGSHLDAERAELVRLYGPEVDSKPYGNALESHP